MLLIALYYISSPRGIISVQFLIFSMKSTTYDKTPYSTTVQFQNITNLTFNAVAQTKRPPKRSYVFTKAIRKRKNCRCIRRTFCECPAANLPRRTFLAFCIGFESWLHLCGSMWAGKPHSGAGAGFRRCAFQIRRLLRLCFCRL